MAGSFHDLKIWQKGYSLVLEVYSLTEKFPNSERFALIDQLRRASNSIIANIAESQGRYSYKDKIRVLYQARGEVCEIRSHLKVAEGLKLISKNDFQRIDSEYEGLQIGINKYIAYLSNR